MSDDKKTGQTPASPAARAPQSIDLPKSAVKDLTPRDATAKAESMAAASAASKAETEAAASASAAGAERSAAKLAVDVSSKAAGSDAGMVAEDAFAAPKADEIPAAAAPAAAAKSEPAAKPASGGKAPVFAGAVAGGVFGILTAVGYATLQAPPVTVADPRVAAVETTLAELEKKLAGGSGDAARTVAALKVLETRATALEQKVAAQPAGLAAGLDDRFKVLDTRIAEARDQAANAVKKLDLIEKSSAPAPVAGAAPSSEAPRVDLAPIAARIVGLEKSLDETAAKLNAGSGATTAIENRIKDVETSVTALKAPRASEAATAVLAISGMARRALEAGEPLGNLLQALGALGVPADTLKPLAVFGEKGAARPAMLADQLAELAAKAKPQPTEAPKEDGVADKVKNRLISLVEIRPAGAPKASDPASALAQVRAKLTGGDFAGALAAMSALPAEQAASIKPVADAIAARLAAQRALLKLETDALQGAARKE